MLIPDKTDTSMPLERKGVIGQDKKKAHARLRHADFHETKNRHGNDRENLISNESSIMSPDTQSDARHAGSGTDTRLLTV
jgi:hypothetical protein